MGVNPTAYLAIKLEKKLEQQFGVLIDKLTDIEKLLERIADRLESQL